MKLHYLNWAFFWLLAVIVFLIVGVLVANEFAGTKYQFFGPGSRWWASDKIRKGLESCPPDHVRVLWFRRYPFTEEEIREYDLSGGTVKYAGIEESSSWWPSGIDPSSVIMVNHDGISKLPPERLAQVEKIIGSMPDSNSTGPLEENLSVAINQQGKLRIYHYQFDGEESSKTVPNWIADLYGM